MGTVSTGYDADSGRLMVTLDDDDNQIMKLKPVNLTSAYPSPICLGIDLGNMFSCIGVFKVSHGMTLLE